MTRIHSKLSGVTFNGRQDNLQLVEPGFNLFWVHEKDNEYDENAILVFADPKKTIELGYLRKELAKEFVERTKQGIDQQIIAQQVTGGDSNKSYGLNIVIKIDDGNEEKVSH